MMTIYPFLSSTGAVRACRGMFGDLTALTLDAKLLLHVREGLVHHEDLPRWLRAEIEEPLRRARRRGKDAS